MQAATTLRLIRPLLIPPKVSNLSSVVFAFCREKKTPVTGYVTREAESRLGMFSSDADWLKAERLDQEK
jgi:hypothetical protein